MTEDGEINKSANRLSGSLKRLFSPEEESHNAKKARTKTPSKALEEVRSLSADRTGLSPVGDRKHQEQQEKTDSCFTVITEVETGRNVPGSLDKSTSAAFLHKHGAEQLEVVPTDGEATLETHGDGDKKTSSDQEQGRGTNPSCCSVCI